MSENKHISIKGARVNNLKNIDVDIPRNKLVVITGLSGWGNRRSLLILSMQKDNVVMSRALAATHASFWDE